MKEAEVVAIIRWWVVRFPLPEPPLTDDFEYSWIGSSVTRAHVLEMRAITQPLERLHIRSVVVVESEGAAFFEAFDPLTGLYSQVAWLFEHYQGRFRRLLEVRQHLPVEQHHSEHGSHH